MGLTIAFVNRVFYLQVLSQGLIVDAYYLLGLRFGLADPNRWILFALLQIHALVVLVWGHSVSLRGGNFSGEKIALANLHSLIYLTYA